MKLSTKGRYGLKAMVDLATEYDSGARLSIAQLAERQGVAFLDAEGIGEFNLLDCMHLTRRGHRRLAGKLAVLVPELLNR